MNALDSPLEALALNYLSFGFLTAVNNLWAWVAVITTAAVSVWRIRASSPRSNRLDESSLLTCFSSSSSVMVERVTAEPAEAEVATPSTSSSVSVFQREGRTSGKFIVYYPEEEEDDNREDCGNDAGNDDVDSLGGGSSKGEEWLVNGWEVVMKMKMGDMGWYRYQDPTVLDGNVVKLWDGCRRRNAAPSTISCCGGEGFISW